ncbi:sensor histidine kinase [Bacillus sp. B1-b2]|uniref:sensor histidine kinase n=1 Tax=Bacillus sp. B1-b2 TaxID=2653201 RepID=UPI0012622DB6|nr:sensor histidine kinase [Bacillus sp. B1-b2]KAB7672655.1 sensor histidine kinase [Bacillus sp. B1-b2]
MNSIQKKIVLLISIIILIMSIIWIALTYYNHRTQQQYNTILQRYLKLNEVTTSSQKLITDINNFMLKPTKENEIELNHSRDRIEEAREAIYSLRNEENSFTLISYIHLMDSLLETTNRLLLFLSENDNESATQEFSEATRISTYISETSLSLLDTELRTYDRFYRGIINQSGEVMKLGVFLLLLIICVLFMVTYWFSLSITRPIIQLTKVANELSNGRFDTQVKIETNDEIAFLARTFDRMRVNINMLITEMKHKAQLEYELQQNKILLQESQFRSLQSQISPHFLFNTLNTISKKAYLEGSEEISDLLVNVAGIIRYNLKQLDRSVTLKEEIDVLQQYITIQKARFTERLRFFLEVDESCLLTRIPSLTLQPIIENAVIHAVEPSEEGGSIWVRVRNTNADEIVIEIQDDGDGIPSEKIQQMLGSSSKVVANNSKGIGIGFSNVVQRLRLIFGYEEVVTVKSEIGSGTTVIITIKETE